MVGIMIVIHSLPRAAEVPLLVGDPTCLKRGRLGLSVPAVEGDVDGGTLFGSEIIQNEINSINRAQNIVYSCCPAAFDHYDEV